jgi:capsular exopolysaccharide synthesis family protein
MEATKNFDTPEIKLHFLDYWRIIRIRKTVILAVFLLVAITTTLVTFVLPPRYASTVRISVEKDASDIGGINGQQAALGFDPYWVQTQFEKIQSKSILHQVITNLQLTKRWAEKTKDSELTQSLAFYLLKKDLTVSQSRNTSLIEIKVESDTPEEAAEIAQKIAEIYRESRLSTWREMSTEGLRKLQEEMDNHNKETTRLQAKLDEMRLDLNISDVEAEGSYGGSKTKDTDSIQKQEIQRLDAKEQYERVLVLYQSLTNCTRGELRRTAATASPDPNLADLLRDLSKDERDLAGLTNAFSMNHPEVLALRGKIAAINRQIDDRLDGIVAGVRIKLEGERANHVLREQAVELATSNDIYKAKVSRPYWALKRDVDTAKFVREQLFKRVWQEKVEQVMPRTAIVQIIDKAEPNLRPVKPNKLFNVIAGVIVGLGIGIGLAFFIEYLDTSVKTIDDVERALQAPVLGVIPQNVGYIVFEGPDSPHAEAYRVLRTNILFSQKDPKLNTITVVSGGAGEGKSTTIFNLATVFAQNGSRVLVVDSDLRRPSLHKVLKVSNSVGLTNFLLKQNTLEEVIQTTPLATLDFMPSGKLPSSSMGVLSSAQMKELIRDLKRRYDYVFFDSPPIMGVSDASILASEVDCVLQVIQYRRYPQPMTIRAKQMIEKVGGNLLGIVLNNINMASDENYYYYSGYYYDYYSKSEDSKPEAGEPNGKPAAREEAGIEIKPKY